MREAERGGFTEVAGMNHDTAENCSVGTRGACHARRLFMCALLLPGMVSLPPAVHADPPPALTGLQRDVTFTEPSPFSNNAEMAKRLLTPLYARRIRQELARSGQALRDQPLDVARQHFAVYVPADRPAHGYALLVFVPPWELATVPREWIPVLDRQGFIFVTAADSGNSANIFDRREPLALLAAHNIMQRYSVDPQRVYVGGFSGGARVALRLALGYPDLFRGALLTGGTDPIGAADAPLPAADLLRQFQNSSRLVYMTGAEDSLNLDKDIASRESLRDWCVFDLDTEAMPRAGHEAADARSLESALKALGNQEPVNATKLADCRARIERELAAKLARLREALSGGNTREAAALLMKIDERFGALAAPQSVEFAAQLESRH